MPSRAVFLKEPFRFRVLDWWRMAAIAPATFVGADFGGSTCSGIKAELMVPSLPGLTSSMVEL